jgi:hypothetical protein
MDIRGISMDINEYALTSIDDPWIFMDMMDIQYMVHVVSVWDKFMVWYHFGITLVSLCAYFGATLGSLWDHFELTLGSHWDHFGVTLGSPLGYSGVTLG